MADFTDYTRDDWVAWVHFHPYDADCELWVPDTVGFQAFVLRRRMAELTDSIIDQADPHLRWLLLKLTQVSGRLGRAKAWFWLQRIRLRWHWRQWQYRREQARDQGR